LERLKNEACYNRGCFASRGNTVFCVENNQEKLSLLEKGQLPFFEPGLAEMVNTSYKAGSLIFTDSLESVVNNVDVIFLAVGTPMAENGAADISYLSKAVEDICLSATRDLLIVNKSTSPPGTAAKLSAIAKDSLKEARKNTEVLFASNPEFLKEGAAVSDFMRPDRIVIGCEDERSRTTLTTLYKPFCRQTDKLFLTDIKSAELIKYAANAMLACRISFMNEIAQVADKIGANINAVRLGIGSDARIGRSFLYSGIGYGGSCFPKDVKALAVTCESLGINAELINQIDEANQRQIDYATDKILNYLKGLAQQNLKISIWGIAFKPNTSDIRESPILKVINELTRQGVSVNIYDPEAMEEGRKYFGHNDSISFSSECYECLKESDLLVVATEWSQFHELDFVKMKNRMRTPAVFDCKNIYDARAVSDHGIDYLSIGNNS
jgi:UDPglucose 6-dehydrogenase